jgi:hypothetical protein
MYVMDLNEIYIYIYISVPSFGLPKSVPILVTHLLLNIKNKKKKIKGPIFKFFLMQNQGYIVFLA